MRTFKFLPVVALAFVTTFSSCKKEKEVEPKIDPRDAFVGEYEMLVTCGTDSGEVELEIEKDATNEKVIILSKDTFENLLIELEDDVEAEVSGSGFKIKETDGTYYDDDGNPVDIELSGEGTLNKGKMEIELEIEFPDARARCEMEGEKK